MNLTLGNILIERYRLLKPLGQGGFSVVWLVEDTVSGTEAAIKIYAPDKGLDQDGLIQFRKEYGRTRGLQHPHLLVPDHLDILPRSQSPFLKMRYCSNGSLNSWFAQEKEISEQEIAKLLEQVGSGLAHLHKKKVIHQDIKPDNILIDENEDFLLTDFGISRQMRSTLKKATANQSYMTVAYSPPERFIADPVDAPAGDVFSLGVTLYELCTGNLPWDGAGGMILNTGAHVPNLPEPYSGRLNNIVKACMDVDYKERPTATQLTRLGRVYLQEGYWGEVESKEKPQAKPKGRKTQKKPKNVTSELQHNDQVVTIADFSEANNDGSSKSSPEKMAAELLQQGSHKISTITKIKNQFGLSLTEAKLIVDKADPEYKTPENKSLSTNKTVYAKGPRRGNFSIDIDKTENDWIISLKKGADISLKITGSIFSLTGLMIWLGDASMLEFIELWPFLLFVMTALTPVITAWVRVKQSGEFRHFAIAVLTTLIWPLTLMMIMVFFFDIH